MNNTITTSTDGYTTINGISGYLMFKEYHMFGRYETYKNYQDDNDKSIYFKVWIQDKGNVYLDKKQMYQYLKDYWRPVSYDEVSFLHQSMDAYFNS